MRVSSFIKRLFVFVTILLVSANFAVASEAEKSDHHKEEAHNTTHKTGKISHDNAGQESGHHEEKSFNPKEFIFNHILDDHYWHILDWKGHPVSAPLPVILVSKESGFHIFSSSKFHHGHSSYKNFEIAQSGKNKGKIIESLPSGEVYLPLDFSITKNVVAAFFAFALMLWIFISIAKRYKTNPIRAPKGKQSFFEPIIIFIRDEVAKPSIGEDKYEKFMPYLLTVFFFILFNNLLGLVPILGANVTGNIAVTLSLALFTFIITSISGNKHYWKEIYNMPGVPLWLKVPVPLMPAVEFIGMLTKPITLMIRLFANITAGHIIALSFFSLIFILKKFGTGAAFGTASLSVAFVIFMTVLELLVAFIQAYVFTLLSSIYFGMATAEHH